MGTVLVCCIYYFENKLIGLEMMKTVLRISFMILLLLIVGGAYGQAPKWGELGTR